MKGLWFLAGAALCLYGISPVAAADIEVVELVPPAQAQSVLTGETVEARPGRSKLAQDVARAGQSDKSSAVSSVSHDQTVQVVPLPAEAAGTVVKPVPTAGTSVDQADLIPVYVPALTDKDFSIGTIRSGDSRKTVEAHFGHPSSMILSDHFTTLVYADTATKVRIVLRNDVPDVMKSSYLKGNAVRTGVDSIFVAAGGAECQLARNIRPGDAEEMLVRQYGSPHNILRDADGNVYYFVYIHPNRKTMLVFAIHDRKVERIALMPARAPYLTDSVNPIKAEDRSERDFSLMGFEIRKPFEANKYNMWERMIPKKHDKFWLYGDYGLQVDVQNTVRRAFLLTNNAYTPRGVTLGAHISTLLALYGPPSRIEQGPAGNGYVDAFYYDSPYQKGVSLVFIIKHAGNCIDDIILTDVPIKNIQEPLKRYGLE